MASRRMVIAALGAAVLLPARGWAQAAQGSPIAPIETLNQALIAVMKAGDGTPFAKRYQMLAPVVDQVFDLPRILRFSVGAYWGTLPPAQQQKLLQVFRSFIVATYVANFHSYNGEVSKVSPTTRSVGQQVVVTSALAKPSGDDLRIDYVMGQTPSGWKIQDILLDGTISRVAVQRSDFASLLSAGDASRLIASLEQKVATLSSGAITS
ncbi:ABC transporter substrate-binding protein [Acidisoma sp. C75]